MDNSLVITCIRHGMTIENQQKKYIGWSDPPLSIEGKNELKELFLEPQLVISSDLKRALETSAVVFPKSQVVKSKNWRELHFGDWEEKTYEDLKNIRAYRNWIDHWTEHTPPNGESFSSFSNRVWAAWEEAVDLAASQQLRHIAIVSHGGPLRLLASHFKQTASLWDVSFSYGEGFSVACTYKQAKERRACISYSAVHLPAKENG